MTGTEPPDNGSMDEASSSSSSGTGGDLIGAPTASSRGEETSGSDAKRPREWTFRRWQVVAGLVSVVVLAMAVGAASRQSTIDDLEDKNSVLRKQRSALSATRAHLTQERDTLQQKVDDRDAQRAADEAAARRVEAERQAAADKAAADARAATDKAAADAAAAEARRNTIGNGVYAIGPDRNPGRYQTQGPTAGRLFCYYALLNSPNTSDISDNNNVEGPAIVDLADGTFFESSGCQAWTRI